MIRKSKRKPTFSSLTLSFSQLLPKTLRCGRTSWVSFLVEAAVTRGYKGRHRTNNLIFMSHEFFRQVWEFCLQAFYFWRKTDAHPSRREYWTALEIHNILCTVRFARSFSKPCTTYSWEVLTSLLLGIPFQALCSVVRMTSPSAHCLILSVAKLFE